MKSSVIIAIFFIISTTCFAQTKSATDTVYYLLDTAKTPLAERMWEVGFEGDFKYFTIKCKCLQYDNQPTFIHKRADKGVPLVKAKLRELHLTTLSGLLSAGQKFVKDDFKGFVFFIIEPQGKNFIMHKMGMAPVFKPWKSDDGHSIKTDSIKNRE